MEITSTSILEFDKKQNISSLRVKMLDSDTGKPKPSGFLKLISKRSRVLFACKNEYEPNCKIEEKK